MYNLQDNSIKSEGGKAIFPLGISENNELTSVEKGQSSNGNFFVKFTFTNDATGATVSHFEWEIDAEREGQEKAAKKFKSQVTRVKHIMTKFVDESQLPVANSFSEFADKIVATLAGKTEGKKFRIKTTYTWNDFVGIPAYVPFIEDMGVSQSKLRITDFDKMEKEGAEAEADVAATLTPNPAFGAPAANATQGDANLPF